jgi:hypothetical protein
MYDVPKSQDTITIFANSIEHVFPELLIQIRGNLEPIGSLTHAITHSGFAGTLVYYMKLNYLPPGYDCWGDSYPRKERKLGYFGRTIIKFSESYYCNRPALHNGSLHAL